MSELSLHDQQILAQIFGIEEAVNGEGQENRALSEKEIEASKLECSAILLAEQESPDYEEALELLDKAIRIAPKYPSPLNNRAQILTLMHRLQESESALNDCITLCQSERFPLVERQALCQRGWLRKSKGEDERAFKDFERSGQLGCLDGRKMATACNPYARLCNQIMDEMLQKVYFSRHSCENNDKE